MKSLEYHICDCGDLVVNCVMCKSKIRIPKWLVAQYFEILRNRLDRMNHNHYRYPQRRLT